MFREGQPIPWVQGGSEVLPRMETSPSTNRLSRGSGNPKAAHCLLGSAGSRFQQIEDTINCRIQF